MTPSKQEIIDALERIKASLTFKKSTKGLQILEYLVTTKLADGPDGAFSEISIGLTLYNDKYDPKQPSPVRAVMGRIRISLYNYYQTEGADNPVRIEIPTGSYVPEFRCHMPASGNVQKDVFSAPNDTPPGTEYVVPVSETSGAQFGYTPLGYTRNPAPEETLEDDLNPTAPEDSFDRRLAKCSLFSYQTRLERLKDIKYTIKLLIQSDQDASACISDECNRTLAWLNLKIAADEELVKHQWEELDGFRPLSVNRPHKNPQTQEDVEIEVDLYSQHVRSALDFYSRVELVIRTLTKIDYDDSLRLSQRELASAEAAVRDIDSVRKSLEGFLIVPIQLTAKMAIISN